MWHFPYKHIYERNHMIPAVLDDKMKLALHGLAPLTTKSTIDFTPDLFKQAAIPAEYHATFTIRGFTTEEGNMLDEIISKASDDN